jgi:ATP-dependent Clp protease ATP-binding subunit ClpC
MFERYTESARRALFYARYEASRLGSLCIDTEHMLLGVIRDAKESTADILMRADCSRDSLRKEIEGRSVFREKVARSVEIPFSTEMQRALQHAVEEADSLGHGYIGTEHLLLGLMREDTSVARSVLAAHGVRLDDAREIASQAGAHADPSREILSGDASSVIDQIKALVRQLARLPSGGNEARALTDRILRALDAFKRPPGE